MLYESVDPRIPAVSKFIAKRKGAAAERGLGKAGHTTQMLPALPSDPGSIERRSTPDERKYGKTVRIRRPAIVRSWVELAREPLLVEFVSALSVGPSPHIRPDLIGRTIAGGKRVKGATTTADIGLRSSPSGFAVKSHLAIPPGRYRKRKKSRRK